MNQVLEENTVSDEEDWEWDEDEEEEDWEEDWQTIAGLSLGLQKRVRSDFCAEYVKGLFGENRRRKSMVEEEDWEEDEEDEDKLEEDEEW